MARFAPAQSELAALRAENAGLREQNVALHGDVAELAERVEADELERGAHGRLRCCVSEPRQER